MVQAGAPARASYQGASELGCTCLRHGEHLLPPCTRRGCIYLGDAGTADLCHDVTDELEHEEASV